MRRRAIRTRSGKRRSIGAQKGWIARSSRSEVIERERARDEDSRSEKAVKMDRKIQARKVYNPKDPEEVMKWRENKSRSDLMGVDTLYQRLRKIKKKTAAKVERTRAKRKKIVAEAKEKVRKIAEEPRKPPERKKREIERVVRTAEKKVETEHEAAVEIIRKAKEEQDLEVRRHQGAWDRERRKRAEYVAGTVGCSVLEADGLIQRTKVAGVDYDRVDWDRLQGKDLTYGERVDKLEEAIGRETRTKRERKAANSNIDWIVDRFEKDEESWQMEIQGAMRDLAEEERIFQAEHGG